MKFVLLLFCVGLLSPAFSQTTKTMGDPIGGADIKLGRKPPGSKIATGVTDKNGVVEFKNLPEGTGYYLEFGIREKGTRSGLVTFEIEGIDIAATGTINTATNRVPAPKEIKRVHGDYEVIITITENVEKGTIITSRSNIKACIIKKNK